MGVRRNKCVLMDFFSKEIDWKRMGKRPGEQCRKRFFMLLQFPHYSLIIGLYIENMNKTAKT